MKKRVYIEIDIDTEAEDSQGLPSRADIPHGEVPFYKVTVRNDTQYLPTFAVVAHELGHVLGHLFQTPGNVGDPRTKVPYEVAVPMRPEYVAPIYQSEVEAWDIASNLVGEFLRARDYCLRTYEPRPNPLLEFQRYIEREQERLIQKASDGSTEPTL